MKRFHSAAALLLAAALVLTGCSQQVSLKEKYLEMFQPENSAPAEEQTPSGLTQFKLPYNINDSLNPYEAATQMNRTILPLLYDPLVKLDEHWNPTPCLASGVEMNGQTCTVTLRSGVLFSDGSALTLQDVLYSLEQARQDLVRYPQLADLVESASGTGNTLTIQLYKADQHFPNLLTFPIIKDGSRGQPLPPGTGRFRLASLEERTLTRNTAHFAGSGSVEQVELVVLPDDETLPYSLKMGVVDCVFSDQSSPEVYSMSSVSQSVEMTNLIYLGINQTHELLAQPAFRTLLGQAVNRGNLARKVYSNRAVEAVTPFHPSFWALPEREEGAKLSTAELEVAMNDLGLGEQDADGYRLYNGSRLTLRLVVHQENSYRLKLAQELVQNLSAIGIALEVVPLENDAYFSAVSTGGYDLFVAELKLGDNMDLTPVLSGASVGVADSVFDLALLESYRSYQAGSTTIEAFLEDFEASWPFLPLLYRRGTVSYSSTLSPQIIPTSQDIFYNMAGW